MVLEIFFEGFKKLIEEFIPNNENPKPDKEPPKDEVPDLTGDIYKNCDIPGNTPNLKADEAINDMIKQIIPTAIIPGYVNWALTVSIMCIGVAKIGKAYGVSLDKEESWKLIIQFFKAASLWFIGRAVGIKIVTAIIESTGSGYCVGVLLDRAISAALAYAIGGAAKAYFKGERDEEKIGAIVRDLFKEGSNIDLIKEKMAHMYKSWI
jgi:uncharacterized protein (DUF697 family)